MAILQSLIVQTYRQLRPWLEQLEEQETLHEGTQTVRGVHAFNPFLIRFIEEIERAHRYKRELGLVVFQITPPPGALAWKWKRRETELALRDCLRKADVPGRLSDTMLGVVLPETGVNVPQAVARITEILSKALDAPVASGYAVYPIDGEKAPDLLRIATRRCSGEVPTPMTTERERVLAKV
jgi:hypothetical protein